MTERRFPAPRSAENIARPFWCATPVGRFAAIIPRLQHLPKESSRKPLGTLQREESRSPAARLDGQAEASWARLVLFRNAASPGRAYACDL